MYSHMCMFKRVSDHIDHILSSCVSVLLPKYKAGACIDLDKSHHGFIVTSCPVQSVMKWQVPLAKYWYATHSSEPAVTHLVSQD